jgi:hypothetical protein
MDLVRKYGHLGALFNAADAGGGTAAAAGGDKPAGDAGAAAAAAAAGGDKGGAAAAGGDKGAAGGETIVGGGGDKGAAAAAAAAGAAASDKGTPDWRVRLAGGDEKFAKTLGRYSDEAAFGKAHQALLAKMSSGEMKRALPENATPEELAAWRKESGLPEKAEGYVEKLELPNGLVIGDADKPIVAKFAEAAFAGNVEPKSFNGLVAKYYEIQDAQRAERETQDATFKAASEDELRTAWQGPAYKQNLTAIQNMLAGWPEGLAASVLSARTADGKKLGDHPAFIKQLAASALEINPAYTLVPTNTTDPAKSVSEELEGIRKLRRENPDKYEADKKLQARELELIDAELKMKKKSAA